MQEKQFNVFYLSLYNASTNPTNTGAHSSLHILMTISLHWVTTMTHDSKNKPWVFCKRNARKSWLESAFTLRSLPADPLFRSSWLSHLKTHVLYEALTPLEASIVGPLQILVAYFRGYASGCCRDQTRKALPLLCYRGSGEPPLSKAPFSGYSCSSSPTSSPSSSPILRLLMQFSWSRNSSRALWHRCGDGEERSRLSFGSSKRVTNAAPNLSQWVQTWRVYINEIAWNSHGLESCPSFAPGQEPEVLHVKHKLHWEVHNVLERKTLWCLAVIEPNPSLVIEVPVVADQELPTSVHRRKRLFQCVLANFRRWLQDIHG